MITEDDVEALSGSEAVDHDGHVIGEVEQVYLDDRTGTPTWVAVETGLPSGPQFVPLHEAWMERGGVAFPYTRERIASAPQLPPGEHLGVEQERRLYDHYGVQYDDDPADSHDAASSEPPRGRDDMATDDTATDDAASAGADDASAAEVLTLFEERLVVGTRVRVSGTTRVSTRVVTEERTITVTVRREELVLDHEPAADPGLEGMTAPYAEAGLEVHPLTTAPRVIVLHEEVPVVTMQTQPFETVHIGVRNVTVEQQVSDNVRREHLGE